MWACPRALWQRPASQLQRLSPGSPRYSSSSPHPLTHVACLCYILTHCQVRVWTEPWLLLGHLEGRVQAATLRCTSSPLPPLSFWPSLLLLHLEARCWVCSANFCNFYFYHISHPHHRRFFCWLSSPGSAAVAGPHPVAKRHLLCMHRLEVPNRECRAVWNRGLGAVSGRWRKAGDLLPHSDWGAALLERVSLTGPVRALEKGGVRQAEPRGS